MSKMNKKAQDFPGFESLEELDTIGLTANQWANILVQINQEAKRLYSAARKGAEGIEDPKAAQQRAVMLNNRARALYAQLRKAVSNMGLTKEEYGTRVVPPSAAVSFDPGSDLAGPGAPGRGQGKGRGTDRDGRSIQYEGPFSNLEKPPIGRTIDFRLDEVWGDITTNPRRVIDISQFRNTHASNLALQLFGRAKLGKKETERKIYRYLQRMGLYRGGSHRFYWDDNAQESMIHYFGTGQNVVYPLKQAVQLSKLDTTYEELYNQLSRGDAVEVFRRFLREFSDALSKVEYELNTEPRVPGVFLTQAQRYGTRWQSQIAEKLRQLR